MNRNTIKGFIVGIATTLTIIAITTPSIALNLKKQAELTYKNISITLNGSKLTPTDANGNIVEPFIIDGTTYLPVRGIANALDLNVDWNSNTNTVILSDTTEQATSEGTYTTNENIVSSVDISSAVRQKEQDYVNWVNATTEVHQVQKEWVELKEVKKFVMYPIYPINSDLSLEILSVQYYLPSFPDVPTSGTYDGVRVKVEGEDVYFYQDDLIEKGIITDPIIQLVIFN